MSTLRVNSLLNAAGTDTPAIDGLAKAWVNFNGQGTVAIRAAFNVSSITDNGTGDYTVNFTNAMVDANYSDVITISNISSNIGSMRRSSPSVGSPSTTTRRFQCFTAAGFVDQEFVSVAVFR